MPFKIIRDDITRVHADAIVNTANPEPIYASGTDGAIYMAAGAEQLLEERKKIGCIPAGEVAVTGAFNLPAKYIIHTVGPAWWDGTRGEFEELASCYRKSLLIAKQLDCESIAFPLISTGVYGFPKDKALTVALETIRNFLDENDNEMDVILVVFDKKAFDLSASLTDGVRQFIDDHYAAEMHRREYHSMSMPDSAPSNAREERRRRRRLRDLLNLRREEIQPLCEDSKAEEDSFEEELSAPSMGMPAPFKPYDSLDDVLAGAGESFRDCLFRLIDERGLKDSTVYKKANIDRKLFSKIRCNEYYFPKKSTALALAVALELNLDETADLIGRAGFAFSPSSKSDLIIEYCIEHRIYNIFEVNALLFEYDQQSIGG